jgi:PadR family transcriptional regulator, regulatory protein PadR
MHRPLSRPAPDFGSREYWSGTIKMSLSRFFILCVLHQRPMHGYDIARAVARTSNDCCSPTEGTIYPALHEFESGGFVTSTTETVSGRARRIYTLTPKGREAFKVAVRAWMEVTHCLVACERVIAGGADLRGGALGCCEK